jgi:hypothetical protein
MRGRRCWHGFGIVLVGVVGGTWLTGGLLGMAGGC